MRTTFAFRLPDWAAPHLGAAATGPLEDRIDGLCAAIRALWQQEAGTAEGDALANDQLRERVYLMMYCLRAEGRIEAARSHMRRAGRRGRRPKSDAASVFVDALHHVFRDDEDGDPDAPAAERAADAVSSKSRPRIARELAYALEHDVPPVLVLPFLRHRTQAEILRRQKLGLVEDWLCHPAPLSPAPAPTEPG
ncbi:hypothetical protein [Frigidibacter sp. MR17.24]|uniref:hypothetical protein n=1 Tax=Frigidibacter sp. MR17.24 TaxID=3127345 RepID=UPI003012FAA0